MTRRIRLIAAGLAALVAGIYLQTAGFDFVFDDNVYILHNPVVRGGLTWEGMRRAILELHLGFWHPLTLLSHMVDVSLFGLSPAGHHMTAMSMHVANTILVFLVLRAFTGSVWRSALAAALFALHPLRVESVAYVSQRKDLLSTFFWFLTMAVWLRYLRRPSPRLYFGALLAFFLGLAAKPMLVTLPFVLLLLDVWPLGRLTRPDARETGRLALEKLPFLALSVGASALAFVAEQRVGALSPIHPFQFPVLAMNALFSYGSYLAKTLWPSRLAVFYPHPGSDIPGPALLAAALALAGLSFLALRTLRRHPFVAVGWCWYLGTLFPVIGFVQIGDVGMGDRYTYVPSVGLSIMAAWGAGFLARGRVSRRAFLWSVSLLALSAFAVLSFRQAGYYRDNITLFTRTLAVTRLNPLIRFNLAVSYGQARRLEEAEREYRRLLRDDPGYLPAYGDLSALLADTNRNQESYEILRAGLERAPQSPRLNYLMGLRLLREGQPGEAAAHFEEAVRWKTVFPEAHNELGIIRARQGDSVAAERHFREALRGAPGFADARENLILLEKLRLTAPPQGH